MCQFYKIDYFEALDLRFVICGHVTVNPFFSSKSKESNKIVLNEGNNIKPLYMTILMKLITDQLLY